jgi:hypothetical protein
LSHYGQATDGPGALFAGDAVSVSNDMASKIREDPLFHIRKKEDEHKKALLNNPVKMKQIQQMVSTAEINMYFQYTYNEELLNCVAEREFSKR